MTTYSTRIILEGWGDKTLELDQYERDQILVQIGTAMARAREEEVRKAQEAARDRAQNSPFIDEAFDFTDWAGVFARFAQSFSSANTFSASTARKAPPAPSRPPTPHTVADALTVLEHYTSFRGQPTIIPPPANLRALIRRAKRKAHPDSGGTSTDFQLVTAAEDVLRRAHRI